MNSTENSKFKYLDKNSEILTFKVQSQKKLNDRNSHLCFDCDLFLLEWDFELDLDFERVWERDRPPFLSLLFPDSGRKKPLCSVSSEQLKIPVNN